MLPARQCTKNTDSLPKKTFQTQVARANTSGEFRRAAQTPRQRVPADNSAKRNYLKMHLVDFVLGSCRRQFFKLVCHHRSHMQARLAQSCNSYYPCMSLGFSFFLTDTQRILLNVACNHTTPQGGALNGEPPKNKLHDNSGGTPAPAAGLPPSATEIAGSELSCFFRAPEGGGTDHRVTTPLVG